MTEFTDSRHTTNLLRQRVDRFESKWAMTFADFAERCEDDTLGQDSYSYEVESDFWEWEEAVTLLAHYRDSESN